MTESTQTPPKKSGMNRGLIVAVVIVAATVLWMIVGKGGGGSQEASKNFMAALPYFPKENTVFVSAASLTEENRHAIANWYEQILAGGDRPEAKMLDEKTGQPVQAATPAVVKEGWVELAVNRFSQPDVNLSEKKAMVGQWVSPTGYHALCILPVKSMPADEAEGAQLLQTMISSATQPGETAPAIQPGNPVPAVGPVPAAQSKTPEQRLVKMPYDALAMWEDTNTHRALAFVEAGPEKKPALWVASSPATLKQAYAFLDKANTANTTSEKPAPAKASTQSEKQADKPAAPLASTTEGPALIGETLDQDEQIKTLLSQANLSGHRDATFMFRLEAASKLAGTVPGSTPEELRFKAMVDQVIPAMPALFGSITFEKEHYVAGKMALPVIEEKLDKNAAIASGIESLMKFQAKPFQGATYMPNDTQFMVSLSELDDALKLMLAQMKKQPQAARQIAGAEQFMTMMGINLENDVLGLFDGETAFVVRRDPQADALAVTPQVQAKTAGPNPQENRPFMLLTTQQASKQQTMEKLMNLLTMQLPKEAIKTEEGDQYTTTLITPPGPVAKSGKGPEPMGYTDLKQVVVFGTQSDLQAVQSVKTGKAVEVKAEGDQKATQNLTALSKADDYKTLMDELPGKGIVALFIDSTALGTQAAQSVQTASKLPGQASKSFERVVKSLGLVVGPMASQKGFEATFKAALQETAPMTPSLK